MPSFKYSRLLCFSCAIAFVSLAAAAEPQEEDLNVRGAFLTTRQNTGGAKKVSTNRADTNKTPKQSNPPRRRRPSSNNNPSQTKLVSESNTATLAAGSKNALASNSVAAPSADAIGLGYTFYMRDPAGDAVRVDPASEFREGDRIRLVLEPNTDGFLYVFHTENDAQPQMLFPDPRLDGGANRVRAHVPYEVPSSREASEQLRWFSFDAKPSVERLYIFVSREPISGIPSAAELALLCRASQQQCAWRPAVGIWSQLKTASNADVQVSKSESYGQKISTDEQLATTRGLGLTAAAPEPSVVRMSVSSSTGLLVTTVDLIHK